MGKFQLDTWKLEEHKTPRKDLLVAVGIYGALLLLSVLLHEPLFLPRGRNLPYVIVLGIAWGGFYLVNLASAAGERRRGVGTPQGRLPGASLRIFGTVALIGEWIVLNNPLLLSQYPLTLVFVAGFILLLLSIPAFSPKVNFLSLFVTIGLSCCFF